VWRVSQWKNSVACVLRFDRESWFAKVWWPGEVLCFSDKKRVVPNQFGYHIGAPGAYILRNSMDFRDESNGVSPGTWKRVKDNKKTCLADLNIYIYIYISIWCCLIYSVNRMYPPRGFDLISYVLVVMISLHASGTPTSPKNTDRLPVLSTAFFRWVHFPKMYFPEGLAKELPKIGLPGGQNLS